MGLDSGNKQGTGSCLFGLGIQRVSHGQWEPWWVRSRDTWASSLLCEDHSGCGGMDGRVQGGEETIAQVCWWFEVRQSPCGWGGGWTESCSVGRMEAEDEEGLRPGAQQEKENNWGGGDRVGR